MCILDSGEREAAKGAYHTALGLLAGGAFLYNLAAAVKRRQLHLIVNTVVYGALVGLEIRQVQHHRERVR